jgi:hypothetical protein
VPRTQHRRVPRRGRERSPATGVHPHCRRSRFAVLAPHRFLRPAIFRPTTRWRRSCAALAGYRGRRRGPFPVTELTRLPFQPQCEDVEMLRPSVNGSAAGVRHRGGGCRREDVSPRTGDHRGRTADAETPMEASTLRGSSFRHRLLATDESGFRLTKLLDRLLAGFGSPNPYPVSPGSWARYGHAPSSPKSGRSPSQPGSHPSWFLGFGRFLPCSDR